MDNEIKEQKEQKVAEEYLSSLADLNMNSKPLINMLTILAEENIEYAAVIVKVVEQHIAKVHPDIKLPILYLIDSIVKNVKNTYIPLFSQCIVNIFCGVFEQVSEKIRERMYTLRQTWNEVFTAQKLYTLDVKVNCMDRNWPITAKVIKSPSIHVNPNFLKKNEMEATLRVKTRELLELEKRKLELELEATKKLLQEQEKQLCKQTESVKIAPEHPPQVRHPSIGAMQKPNYIGINTYQKFRNNGPRQPPPNMMNMQQIFPPGVAPPQLIHQQKPKVHPVNPIMLNTIRHRDPRLARQQQQQQQQQPSSQEKEIKPKLNANFPASVTQTSDQQASNQNINSGTQGSSSYRNSKAFDSRTTKRRETDRSNHNRPNHDRSPRDRSVRDRSSKSRSEEEHSDGGSAGRSKSTNVSNRNKRGGSRSRSESKSPTRVRSSSTRSSNRSGSSSRDKDRRNKSSSFDRRKGSSRNNDSKFSSSCPKIDEESETQNDSIKKKTNSPTISPTKFKDSKSKSSSSVKVLKTYAGRKHKPRTPSPNATKDVDFRIIHPDKRARLTSLKNDTPAEEEKAIMPPPPPSMEEEIPTIVEPEDKVLAPEVKPTNIEKDPIEIDPIITNATAKTLDQNLEAIHSVKDVDLRQFQRITSKAHQSSTSTPALIVQSINKLEKSSEIATCSTHTNNNNNNKIDAVNNEVKDEPKTNVSIVEADIQAEAEHKEVISNGKPIGENKRPSTDDAGEPNAKRSKSGKMDGLFGTEDVDLRTVIPTVILNPTAGDIMTPPPPPVISNEKENWAKVKGSPATKLTPIKSSLDDVRAKLAKAARYNKMEKSHRELSQKFKIYELQDETTSQECNDNKIRTIISQAQELLESRNINQEQYHNLVKTVMQINETNKLNAAKRLESLSSSEKDLASDAKESVVSVDESSQDKLDLIPSSRQITGEKEKRVKVSKWSAPAQPTNNHAVQSQPQPQRQRFGPNNRPPPPFNNRMLLPSPWQNPSSIFNGATQSRRPPSTVPAPPQPPTLVIPKPCNSIDNPQEDVVRSITIDGRTKEIRFYGNVAIVFMDWDQPREIGFQPGTRTITIDNKESIVLNFNEDYKEVTINGEPHRMRFAFPSRELYIDEHWYEVYFGGPAMPIPLNNKIHLLQAEGPPPQVHIGILRRDLVVGKINMIVDARNIIPVFLDANPQTFTIDGQQHIIEFADNLKTVIINGEFLNVEYGGLPKSLMLGGRKYFVRFGTLPSGIVAGQHVIKDMKYINMQPPQEIEKVPDTIVPCITDTEPEIKPISKLVDGEITEPIVRPKTTSSPPILTQPVSIPGIAPILPNVNIDELFQKLISTGIINNVANNGSAPENKNVKEEEIKPIKELEPIKPINLNVPETIKTRQAAIINAIFCGMQCSSCGVRFPPEQTIKYSQHLDWHFRQNRRERDSARKAHSRKWYYEISDWLQYEEIEDLEDREKNFFESQQIDLENIDENSNQRTANSPVPSCPAEPGDVDRACDMCQEKFEQFYNEDQEEWHLRAAIRVEDKIYHPLCYEDYKVSLNPPKPEVEEKIEDQNITAITIDDDNAVDVAIVKKEAPEGSHSETQVIPDDDEDDDDVIVVPAEEPSITEIDDDEEYVPVNMSREEMGGVADDGVASSAVAINETMESDVEIQEPNIPFTDLDTYIEKPSVADDCSQSSLFNVKIKEEPKDDEDDDGFEDVGIVLMPEEEISIQSSDENTGTRTISSTVSTPLPSPIIADTPAETSQPPSEEAAPAITVEIPETGDSLEGNLESNDNPLCTTSALLGVNKIKINMTKNIVTSNNSTSNPTTKSISLNQNPTTCGGNVSNISTIPVLCSGPMSISAIPTISLDSTTVRNEESSSLFSGHSAFSAVSSFCTPISSAATETSSNVIQVITSHTTSGPNNMDSFSNCIEVIGSNSAGGGGINVPPTIRDSTTPPLSIPLKPVEVEQVEPTFTFKPELQNVKLKKVKKIDCGVEASGLCSIM
ncbi:uncharacterized protein LOC129907897 isoform X2 [Episyrphus balteatus]|uniref:uncharacterized protein LOC129907897 isoform X2 n=1 Tax=Episyrphus balteatus TaxID=286459 RepID=UPI002485D2F9|nr:uncharacterized protein LOC129907897 isoform X2 [Episyrphus balteatus]